MEQIPLALAPGPAPSFENYYPGPNRAAVAALRAACEGGGERFLFLWGPAGSGKSHLLRAAAHSAARPPAGCAEPADGCGPACYVNAPHPLAEAGAGWPPALLAVDDCQRLDIVGQLALFDHYNAMRAGGGVLTQFEGLEFKEITLPFIDSLEKAESECMPRIREALAEGNCAPIVFSTLVNREARDVIRRSGALVFDFFETFIDPLEAGLGMKSNHTIGRSHSSADKQDYKNRIEAINFSMAHDDGASHRDLAEADVILVGVSRSGKTPTSLYLAMQFGIKAANYPLIPEDFERRSLPEVLKTYRSKLYGLSIAPERLSEIRQERRPGSEYARLSNCRFEVDQAEGMMRREGIHWINSTTKSIEEIATTVLRDVKLERHVY